MSGVVVVSEGGKGAVELKVVVDEAEETPLPMRKSLGDDGESCVILEIVVRGNWDDFKPLSQ